ncbi:MAG: hypothetical protein JXB38_05900 [Anaerolineales bacterium]|nr:hypothetical protein [Anaerolineales bacterium]
MSEEFYEPDEPEAFEAESYETNDPKVWKGEDWNFSGPTSWVWGAALIFFGALFLVQNYTGLHFLQPWNLWALFILIPGLSMLSRAWNGYQMQGNWSGRVGQTALFGAFLTLIALGFIFNFSFNLVWPLVLVGVGVYLLLSRNA